MSTEGTPSKASAFVPTHPFDKRDGADAVLRSSDGADFYVHRLILSLASPVFETMFSLPQAETTPDLPVVDLSECAVVLEGTLRLIYPGACPNIETTDLLQEITEVLLKYDMQSTLPVVKLHLEKFHSTHPLAVYALAVRCGWNDLAMGAARESLKHTIRVPSHDAFQQLNGLSAAAYHSLLQYHFQCAQAVDSTTSSLKWFPYPAALENCACSVTFSYSGPATMPPRRVPRWFYQFLKDIAQSLSSSPALNVWDTSAASQALKEPKCDSRGQFDFHAFVTRQLPTQLNLQFDKVQLIDASPKFTFPIEAKHVFDYECPKYYNFNSVMDLSLKALAEIPGN
ncbi:hypothetical protein FB45DRAFT_1137708 [Roridomyces roridus]|uniref:BTB domain-containing protein n=1 Tax=Roridomyces roridus TaxID=1738132 RepID=A0AAD7FS16_9AGAR|nr:hypothetical protein FB45DRAFT_1137708 [Roridomyces roridus]